MKCYHDDGCTGTGDTFYQSSFNQQYDTLWLFTFGAKNEATTVVLITATSYVSPFTVIDTEYYTISVK